MLDRQKVRRDSSIVSVNRKTTRNPQQSKHYRPVLRYCKLVSILGALIGWFGLVDYLSRASQTRDNLLSSLDPLMHIVRTAGREIVLFLSAHPWSFALGITGLFLGVGFLASMRTSSSRALVLSGIFSLASLGQLALTNELIQIESRNFSLAILCYLAAVWLSILGISSIKKKVPRRQRILRTPWILGGILLLGGALRLYRLDSHIPETDTHKINQAIIVLSILEHGVPRGPSWFSTWYNFFFNVGAITAEPINPIPGSVLYPCFGVSKPLSTIITVLWFSAFGVNIVSMRLIPVTIGLLTILMVYRLTRYCYSNDRIALLAAWLTTVSPFLVNYSRYESDGLHNISTLHALLVMDCLIRALRTGRMKYFIGCGMLIGSASMVYESSLFTAPITVVVLILHAVLNFKTINRRALAIGSLILLVMAGTLLAPKVVSWVVGSQGSQGMLYSINPVYPLKTASSSILKNLSQVFAQQFYESVEENTYHRDGPVVNSALMPFFVLGLIIAVSYLKRPEFLMLMPWYFVGVVPVALFERVAPRRYLLSIPCIYITIALGLALSFELIPLTMPRIRSIWHYTIITALLILAIVNTYLFFDTVRVPENERNHLLTIGNEIKRALPDYYAYVLLDAPWDYTFKSHSNYDKSFPS